MEGISSAARVLLFILMLCIAGFPIAYTYLRKEYSLLRLISTVFFGMAFIVIIGYLFAILQFRFTLTFYFFVIWVIFSLIFILKNINKIKQDFDANMKYCSILIITAIIYVSLLMYPQIKLNDFNIIVGSNSDFGLHASIADHIAEYNIYSPIPNLTSYYIPIKAYIFDYAGPKAFHVLLALGVKISGTPAYGIYMILSALLASLGIFSMYLLCRKFGLSESSSLIATFLIMFSQATVYFYFDDFAPQVLGFSVFPIALIFTVESIEQPKAHNLFLTALLVSLLIASHPMATILYILSVFFLISLKCLSEKISIKIISEPLMKIGLITLILNPRSMYEYIITTIAHAQNYSGGNIRVFPNLSTVLNLDLIGNVRLLPDVIVSFLEIFIIIMLIYGIYYSVKKNQLFILSCLFAIIFYALATYIKGAPYEFSKAIPFYFMLISIFIVIALDNIKIKFSDGKLKFGYAVTGILIFYIFIILILTVGTTYAVSNRNTDINSEVNFYKILSNNIDPGSKVYFISGFLPSVWAQYFIKDADVIFTWDIYTHRGNVSLSEYDQIIINLNSQIDNNIIELENNASYSQYIFVIRDGTDRNGYLLDKDAIAYLIISKNKLKHIDYNSGIHILSTNENNSEKISEYNKIPFLYSGWYGPEKYQDTVNFRWTHQNFTIVAYLTPEMNHTLLLGTLSPVTDNNLTLYINDKFIETKEGNGNTQFIFKIPNMMLNNDAVFLKIEVAKTFRPDETIHNGDKRILGLAINRVLLD